MPCPIPEEAALHDQSLEKNCARWNKLPQEVLMAVLRYIEPAIFTCGNLTTLCPRGQRASNTTILCQHLEFACNIAGDSGIPESLRTPRRCAEHAKERYQAFGLRAAKMVVGRPWPSQGVFSLEFTDGKVKITHSFTDQSLSL